MHHTLDIHPFPKDVLYINEFELVDVVNTYDSQKKHDKALSGKCKKEGGVGRKAVDTPHDAILHSSTGTQENHQHQNAPEDTEAGQ